MTGRLNPRRYDLGELRDVSRGRSDHPEPDRTAGDRPVRTDGSDDGTAVPVETTESLPRHRNERRRGKRAVDAETVGMETGTGTETEADLPTESDPDPEPDEVEAYLRSRHRRRETANGRGHPNPDQVEAGDRRAEKNRGTAGDYSANAAAFLAELSGSQLSKPYLDQLPDAYSAQLEVFEWLERLLESGGHDATLSALEYYESIGWLSDRSRAELEDVVAGLSTNEPASASLCLDDHRESLLYVARLAQRRTR